MKRTKNIYKRFFSLFIGQTFFIRRGKLAVKRGMFSYEKVNGNCQEIQLGRIAPWTRVRTLIPVKPAGRLVLNHDLQPGRVIERPIQSVQDAIANGKYWPRAKDCLGPTGPAGLTGGLGPTGPLRDPMDQDHSPQPQPQHDRTL